jgi:protein-histidine pros-kinase
MTTPLRVLILEDQPADAELMCEQLVQAGYEPEWQRVETEAAYLAALDPAPELMLSDHSLPQFNAQRALERLRERDLDIPFIIVSGTIGEELAVLLMRNGAADYVWKDRMRRLGPAVAHALKEIRVRKEKRHAERKLRESETWFRALIDQTHDGISVLDANAAIRYVSPSVSRILGYTPEELIGRDASELIHPQDRMAFRDAHTELLGRPATSAVALHRVRHKDGSWHWLESVGTNFLGELPVDGIIRNFRDITERKRNEEALREAKEAAEEASRVKSRFLATMSHELRTPLNSIIGFTGMMLMKLSGPLTAEQERQLQTVERSANHLLSLINDLLDLNKIEAGKLELNPEPVVCQTVVKEILRVLESLATRKGLRLEWTPPPEDLVVRTDRRALTEILLNVVSNAIKFTEHGQVRVDLEPRVTGAGATAEFRIMDTGIGITLADQARLFRPFEQLDGYARAVPGTGLGLFLSRKLANLLGGNIQLTSEYGRGTTVTLTVPRNTDGNQAVAADRARGVTAPC